MGDIEFRDLPWRRAWKESKMEYGKGQESQASIVAWSVETFGVCPSNLRLASRANEELAEAVRSFAADPNSIDAAKEAADVIIVLCSLADAFGVQFNHFQEQDMCRSGLSPAQLLMDANTFMAHLLDSLIRNDNDMTATHWIYGCYQKLCWFIRRIGLEPYVLVNQKMIINRSRKWVKDDGPGGTGRQVRPEKIEVVPTEAGWVCTGEFMGWPVAVPIATPDVLISALRHLHEKFNIDAVGVSGGVGKVTFGERIQRGFTNGNGGR